MKQRYEFIIRGHLSSEWSDVFNGMEITLVNDGNTRITGVLPDQSALYGLLTRMRDLGLTLISVTTNPLKEEE